MKKTPRIERKKERGNMKERNERRKKKETERKKERKIEGNLA